MKLLCAVIAMTLATIDLHADDHVQGSDGFFYLNGVAHSRTFVAGHYYYSNGCRYWSPGYYNYVRVEKAAAPADWRAKLLDIKKEQVEQQNYLDSLKFLGLDSPSYNRLSGYGSLQIGNYGANGSTVYGYSLASLADIYGKEDLAALFQQAARLTENAQSLAGQAHTGFDARMAQRLSGAENVAKVLAATELLKSLQSGNQASAKFEFRVDQGKAELLPEPKGGSVFERWNAQAQQCAACHFGAGKADLKGGFDISTWPGLSTEKKMEYAIKYLLTKDETKRMPRTADGKPGPAIKEEDVIALWLKVTK